MVKIVINGCTVEAHEGASVLRAAEDAGFAIPRFCNHPAFPPEGSCRLCLVEIEGTPKLELSCSTNVREGMRVVTDSPRVLEARRSVVEFLLAEHPLDCPICDKAGECLLQDAAAGAGQTSGVFAEKREAREKKLPLSDRLILDRERCIVCTRCVRFLRDVTKTRELGVFERGIGTAIGLYDGEPVRTNYSGNLVDLCPVGAITDRDFRFKTRVWFLEPRPAVCPFCSRGCALWADYHPGFPRVPGSAGIFRFRPRLEGAVNGYWICDLGRTETMGLVRERTPVSGGSGKPGGLEYPWDGAVRRIAGELDRLRGRGRIREAAILLSSALTCEELFLARSIFVEALGITRIAFADPPSGTADALLLRDDRSPNRAGASALGFRPEASDLRTAVSGSAFLWVFGADREGLRGLGRATGLFEGIALKVLSAPRAAEMEPLFDLVLPTSSVFEKDGSFVNCSGLLQPFVPVHPPCGDARPEWRVLLQLGRELGLGGPLFAGRPEFGAVARALREAHPTLGGGR